MRRRSSRPRRLPLALLALSALSLGACGACGGGEDEASIEERLEEKGTMEVMEEAGKAEYDPPANGRLSERQVEQFIEIEERATRIRQVAQKRMEERTAQAEGEAGEGDSVWAQVRNMGDAMQGFGDLMTAEIRAAQELGYNPAEFQWVREQVLEAQATAAGMKMKEGMGEAQRQILAGLEEQRDAIDDPDRRAALDEQIATFRDSFEDAGDDAGDDDELEPGVAENVELVERYQDRIQAAFTAPEEEEGDV